MLHSVPQEIVITLKYLQSLCENEDKFYTTFNKTKHYYVHWQSVLNWLKNSSVCNNNISRYILELWEEDILRPIPDTDNLAELQAIFHLNDTIYPDNVQVYCSTFGEYVELRKHFSKEDVKY